MFPSVCFQRFVQCFCFFVLDPIAAFFTSLARKDLPLLEYAVEFTFLMAFNDAVLNSLFWIGANYHRSVDLPDTTGGRRLSGVWRVSCPDQEHSQTQSPAHHLPAVRSPSPSPPWTTSHRRTERQSWGSLPSRCCKWHQTRCESRLQRPPWGKKLWTARSRRGAPPTAPWLRVSWVWIWNCGAQKECLWTYMPTFPLSSLLRWSPLLLLFPRPAQRGLLFPMSSPERAPASTLSPERAPVPTSSPERAPVSHVQPREGSCFHVKPREGSCPHVQPREGCCSHVKPREGSCSHVQPREGCCSHIQPREGSCFPIQPREGCCSHVWPREGLRFRVQPRESFCSWVQPREDFWIQLRACSSQGTLNFPQYIFFGGAIGLWS